MINKIKDFLQKLKPKPKAQDDSDQAQFLSGKGVFKTSRQDVLTNIKTRLTQIKLKRPTLAQLKASTSSASSTLLSPSLSRAIEKFLARPSREPIHQIALVVIVCGITYTLGKMSALVMRGTPVLDSAKDYTVSLPMEKDFNVGTLNQVRGINLFRTNTGLGSKKKLADANCEKAQQTSTLPIKLINTVVLQDSVKSIASVQIRGNRALEEMREGDQIDNLAKIFRINRLEILIKNLENGVCESIGSDRVRDKASPITVMSAAQGKEFLANKKMSGIDNDGNKFKISKTLIDEKMKNIAAILTQARAIKIQNPDGSLSFKLTELDPQGIFPYLGLQDQDIITSINGKPIYDINEIMSLFGRIKNLENLQLGVKREGSDSVQEYSIKQ